MNLTNIIYNMPSRMIDIISCFLKFSGGIFVIMISLFVLYGLKKRMTMDNKLCLREKYDSYKLDWKYPPFRYPLSTLHARTSDQFWLNTVMELSNHLKIGMGGFIYEWYKLLKQNWGGITETTPLQGNYK